MSQETRVYKLGNRQQAAELERRLQDALPPEAEWRPVPHARFSVKAQGIVTTCYHSGKLVVQGRDLDSFEDRFLGEAKAAKPKQRGAKTTDPELRLDVITVGSDEAGKGDYLGPLVVTAVYAGPSDLDTLTRLGVADSKTVTDSKAHKLAGALQQSVDFETVRLDPEEYNRRHSACGNLNLLLAELHAEAIAALCERHSDVALVLVDRFGAERLVADALRAKGVSVPKLTQVPRAERHPAVAAASLLARAAFLDGLAECGEACASDLHPGAGHPADEAARRVFAIGGRDLLGKVAKLHFKNTSRVAGSS